MRKKRTIAVLFLSIYILSGCNSVEQKENNLETINLAARDSLKEENNKQTVTADDADKKTIKLDFEIADNISIDAEIETADQGGLITYSVEAKEFIFEQVAQALNVETVDMTEQYNPNGRYVEMSNGEVLFVKNDGGIDYIDSQETENILYLIQTAYASELDQGNNNISTKVFENESQINTLEDKINQMCGFSENEKIQLLAGVQVENDVLLEQQQKEFDLGILQYDIEIGKYQELEGAVVSDKCYYLIFGCTIDDIPVLGMQEPAIRSADDNAIIRVTSARVLIDNGRIRSMELDGMFNIKADDKTQLKSIEEICDILKKKYEIEIITAPRIIRKAYLEYVFVHDNSSADLSKGKLVPYWCFEVQMDDHIYAERINAITGGDFAYGE